MRLSALHLLGKHSLEEEKTMKEPLYCTVNGKRFEIEEPCELELILMERDAISPDDAREQVTEARKRVAAGENPEDILFEVFGLEPDYVFDLF
jgi:hypothetical protein